jgi:TIGR03009 family protein
MRAFVLAAALLLSTTWNLQAQQPQAPGDPQQARLDAHLQKWEKEMQAVQSIRATCVRTTLDKTFQVADVFEGTAKYMKPNLALLEMQGRTKPQVFEKYICTGTFLYQYFPSAKEIRVHEIPAQKPGQVGDDSSFMAFLFGMKADEARKRYDLKLIKEDQWYIYIEILPRLPSDKSDFQKARLVLNNRSYLPRELWFMETNGNEVKWDIPRIESGVGLNRNDFTSPPLPSGWRFVRVPRSDSAQGGIPPRIVRPNQ